MVNQDSWAYLKQVGSLKIACREISPLIFQLGESGLLSIEAWEIPVAQLSRPPEPSALTTVQ